MKKHRNKLECLQTGTRSHSQSRGGMMFTDYDLQQLKEKYNYANDSLNFLTVAIELSELKGLLERLEAAEEFIRLGSQEQSVNSIELRNAEEEWRKECGK